MYPYISHVTSNVKKRCDHALYPKTIIVGSTGSGKSSITDAVELALTGTVDNVGGKPATMPIDLMKLKCRSAGVDEPLFASCHITTDLDPLKAITTTAKYEASGSTEKASRPKHFIPDIVGRNPLPLRAMKQTLLKNQDELRAMFLAVVGTSVTIADITALLVTGTLDEFKNFDHAQHEDIPSGAYDEAFNTLELFSDFIATKKKEASAAHKRMESVSDSAGTPPTDADLQKAEEEYDAAEDASMNAAKALGAAESDINAFVSAARTQHAAPAPVIKNATGIWTVGNELLAVLKVMSNTRMSVCPACKSDIVAPDFITKRRDDVAAKLKAASQPQIKIHTDPFPHVDIPAALTMAKLDAVAAVDGARIKATAAHNKMLSLRESRVAYENALNARKVKAKAAADIDLYKRMGLEVRAALDTLLLRGTGDVVKRVQKYLPEAYKFSVQLTAGDRRVCHIGFMRDGAINTAISDGERCLLLCALAIALNDDPFKVIIPPDCSMDPVTLAAMLFALKDAPAQIILTSTTTPAVIPSEWTVIHMNPEEVI